MKCAFCILSLVLAWPSPVFSGELGQKIFKKYIEFTRSREISRGSAINEDLCANKDSYTELSKDDKKALSAYWYSNKSDTPYCGMMLALQDADSNMRQATAFTLGKKCKWENDEFVIELARRKHLGWMLVHAIGECRKQKAVPVLYELVKDTHTNVADTAVEALGKIGDVSSIPVIKEVLKNEKIGLKGAAALALARLGENELSRQTAKELLNMPDAEGDIRLPLMHAQYAASHVYEYVGDEKDLPYIKELRTRSLGTESSIATARAIVGIMHKAGLQFKDWDATSENKIVGITSLQGGEECWLGKEKQFLDTIKPLEKVIGLPYMTIFRKYANDSDVQIATRFIGDAKYNMQRKDAEKILSEVIASSNSEYIRNLAKDRLRQVSE